jgi:hypothetical protein
MFAKYDF